ncbi:MAG: hypothetical protein WC010_04125 [Candidatus Absconditabacterales bacterium]
MGEYLKDYHEDEHNKYADKQSELADNLKKQTETMEKDINALVKIAKIYYGNVKSTDFTRHIQKKGVVIDENEEDEDILHGEDLYTLIKYQKKDLLVHIGTGVFDAEVFTRKDVSKCKGLSHSPLPLFVVASRADKENKDRNPKQFLLEHAMIYSPKGGQAELRNTSKQTLINYGISNGIMNYEDAVLVLKNAQIHKEFPNENSFDKFVKQMKKIEEHAEFKRRISKKIEDMQDEDDREFYSKMLLCLSELGEDQEKIYEVIQSFDTHKKAFIK